MSHLSNQFALHCSCWGNRLLKDRAHLLSAHYSAWHTLLDQELLHVRSLLAPPCGDFTITPETWHSTRWCQPSNRCTYVRTAVRHTVLYFLQSVALELRTKEGEVVVCLTQSWKVFTKVSWSEGALTPWWALGKSFCKWWHLVRVCPPCVSFFPEQNHCCAYPNGQHQVSGWDLSFLSKSSDEVWIHVVPAGTLGIHHSSV